MTGSTFSPDFPTTTGAFQQSPSFRGDAFVTKLDAVGSVVYSTYLGGAGGEDEGIGIAVDASGNAYVTGDTNSADFPVTKGAFQTACRGCGPQDAFVTKLNPSGTALVYSTFLGGNNKDKAHGIAVDGAGNAYVTGDTASSDFPRKIPIQNNFGGFFDIFVTKLNPTGVALQYSTYLGGTSLESARRIVVDSSGSAYIAGFTSFPADFPISNAFQPAPAGCPTLELACEGIVARLSPDGSSLVFSSYLGGTSQDQVHDIAVDGFGNVYVTGRTASTDFPTTEGAFQGAASVLEDAFFAELVIPAANDNFADAVGVGANPFMHIGNSQVATIEAADPTPSCGNGSRAKSIWYRYSTPSTSRNVSANTVGSAYDTILSVFTGSPGAFTERACGDNVIGSTKSAVSFRALAGTTYFFMVSARNGDGGNMVFNFSTPVGGGGAPAASAGAGASSAQTASTNRVRRSSGRVRRSPAAQLDTNKPR